MKFRFRNSTLGIMSWQSSTSATLFMRECVCNSPVEENIFMMFCFCNSALKVMSYRSSAVALLRRECLAMFGFHNHAFNRSVFGKFRPVVMSLQRLASAIALRRECHHEIPLLRGMASRSSVSATPLLG